MGNVTGSVVGKQHVQIRSHAHEVEGWFYVKPALLYNIFSISSSVLSEKLSDLSKRITNSMKRIMLSKVLDILNLFYHCRIGYLFVSVTSILTKNNI